MADSRRAIITRLLQCRTIGEFKTIMLWAKITRSTIASAVWTDACPKVPGRDLVYTPITHYMFIATAERLLPIFLLPFTSMIEWWMTNHNTMIPHRTASASHGNYQHAHSYAAHTMENRLADAARYTNEETGWFRSLPWVTRYVHPLLEAFFASPTMERRDRLRRTIMATDEEDVFGNEFGRSIITGHIVFDLKPGWPNYATSTPTQKSKLMRMLKTNWTFAANSVTIRPHKNDSPAKPPSLAVLEYVESLLPLFTQNRWNEIFPIVNRRMVALLASTRTVDPSSRPAGLRFSPNETIPAYADDAYIGLSGKDSWDGLFLSTRT